jgi:hypothetical protein
MVQKEEILMIAKIKKQVAMRKKIKEVRSLLKNTG